jgi:hypothetical protein
MRSVGADGGSGAFNGWRGGNVSAQKFSLFGGVDLAALGQSKRAGGAAEEAERPRLTLADIARVLKGGARRRARKASRREAAARRSQHRAAAAWRRAAEPGGPPPKPPQKPERPRLPLGPLARVLEERNAAKAGGQEEQGEGTDSAIKAA